MDASPLICMPGGGGFVGSHLAPLLVRRGYRLRVPVRRRESCKHLAVFPEIELVEADIHAAGRLRGLFADCGAVINLVGLLHETARPGDSPQRCQRHSFEGAHVELTRHILEACRQAGVPRYLHMSALGADPVSHSAYQRSKAAGEALALDAHHGLDVTVFRPSVIFGPGDRFLSLFAGLLRLTPIVPLADGHARFQPVYVGDVARAFADALPRADLRGRAFSLCGPRVYTLAELVRMTARAQGLHRWVIPLGPRASYTFARLMELKPGMPLMTRDNHYAMQQDNICGAAQASPFICPTHLESVIGYLFQQDPRRAYAAHRARARR